MNKQTRELLGELAGAASLCWEPRPTGVFDPEQASKFVAEAESKLDALIQAEIHKATVEARIDELENLIRVKQQPGVYWGDVVLDTIQSRLKALQSKEGEVE